MKSVFITGSSGFVGRHLVRRLLGGEAQTISCLSRTEATTDLEVPAGKVVQHIRGSLFDTALYERELAQSECVVHLAAATGKAAPEEHFRVNLEGTRTLVSACQQAGVRNFLHISTIAVKFPDKTRYPYAQAKQQAEDVVRASGLRFTIVRPTMVLGRGSAVLEGLARLAALPIVPIFGDGKTRVQPIEVNDLANLLAAVIDTERFRGETLELGGPQSLTIEELLCMIALLRKSGRPRTVHLPMGLLLPVLSFLESFLYAHLPFTVGQLATFRFDGTAEGNSLWEERKSQLKTPGAMLGPLFAHESR
ncbi:MAG TPA: NAD-dependent epimerase/dehydratase family protein [Candidatus Nitrosotenuis sp.]|nr:NAD-dependent epimerase/dehydratase family protein [Candidatus Nitrosotenuis sp.]